MDKDEPVYVVRTFGRYTKKDREYRFKNKAEVKLAFQNANMDLFSKFEIWRLPNTLVMGKYEEF